MVQKIANKYKSLPIQLKATVWFIVCQAVQSGCKFFTMPFLVRLLTPDQYGIYSVFLSWISIFTIFTTLNLHAGVYNNAMLKYKNNRDKYTAVSQSISIIATLFCAAVYFAFSGFWDILFGLEPQYSILIFVQLLFTEGYLLWSSRQRYEYKYIALFASTFAFSFLYMVIPITSVYIAPNEARLSIAIFAGVAVQSIFGGVFLIYNYIKGKCFYQREYWKYALGFNIPLIPHYLSGIVLGQADRVMIKSISGAAKAGIYSFTYNISMVINIVTGSINNALVPYEYSKLKAKDFKALKSIANITLILVGGMVLAFSAIAPEFIKIFATEEYYEAVYLVPVIALSSYFTFLYSLCGNVEFFFEENKFITVASSIGAVMNIILNWCLIPVFGYFAAGYTTLFCYIMFAIAHYGFMRLVCRKYLNGVKVYDGKVILVISASFVALSFGMMLLYDYWLIRYVLIAVAMIILFYKRQMLFQLLKTVKEGK